MIRSKSSCIIGIVFFESSFDSFCFDSPAVRGFSFFETAGCTRQFFSGEFRDVSVLLIVFNVVVKMVTSVYQSCFAALFVFCFIVLT